MLTKNQFAVGGIERHYVDIHNSVSLAYENGAFIIRGFKDGRHFVEVARTRTAAYKLYRMLVAMTR